ncbi:uncharacterized protein LOC129922451 [Biomphalaria glabrata]|uniref:Uncharacterized protein LOC129922451 n=1 Tax=Biomphalaria glabrata TaxID=6526 RepID=A0A9W2YPD0_BIOGL|nr:uncharacterized protein LOC129922451 [Biomphalaria glabrata]XP_055864529.1 uncharacterized protein LOC129922451 [Biomphalaria glabrata]XP_055864531.1 uncharacterized protein LOC129922451 [Biomphalaria glabrata]XP_055864532.1 uncharacterized protein LOC129922451 [Biomphalaria glabrata]
MLLPSQSMYIFSCFVSAVGLALVVVGVTTPVWTYAEITKDNKTTKYSQGLWQSCEDGVCQTITKTGPATMMSCKVLSLISAVCALLCFTLLMIHLVKQICKIPSPQCYFALAMVAGGCSAVFIIISVCIWRAEYFDEEDNIYVGYSLILPIVGGILVGLSGGAGAFSSRNYTAPRIK